MNIQNNDLQLLTIPQLMRKHFFIPDYQRGYRWGRDQIYQLLEDLWKYFKNGIGHPTGFYCLQPIVVKVCTQETMEKYKLEELSSFYTQDVSDGPRDDVWYEVIDGQQRLTTIRILLAYCKYWAFNSDIPFTLTYATRPELRDIFDCIRIRPYEKDVSIAPEFSYLNVDVEYVKECAEFILAWFRDDSQVEANKINGIQQFLGNFYNDSSKDVSVQVIWYETKESTDARDIFERLNNLKVPLSSSELIRAMFLSENSVYSFDFSKQQESLPEDRKAEIREEDRRRKQGSINAKWDEIEHFFHNDRFWAFITNKDAASYRNRIEILFDFISKKYSQKISQAVASDRLFTYLHFEKHKKDLWDLWMEVIKYYDTIRFWFEDKDYYHKIGYLIHEKHDDILIDLLEFANSDDHKKSMFEKKLNDEIRNTVKTDKKFSELTYEDDHNILKSLLLLYNIEYTRQHSSGEKDLGLDVERKYFKQTPWFPFYLYKEVEKKGSWTLEHIHAQSSVCLDANKRAEWRDWIAYTIVARGKMLNPSQKVIELIEDLKKEKAVLDEELKSNVAKENYEKIVDLFKRDLDLWSEGKAYTVMHELSNLTLLSGDINSGLGKGAFSMKQQYINKSLADGRYIPVCTAKVFLKHYYPKESNKSGDLQSDLLSQQTLTWDDQDRTCYLNDIKEVLGTFFDQDKF